jgi:hypothetical protein
MTTNTPIKSDFNNAQLRFNYLHGACMERMNDNDGVLSKSFFSSVSDRLDQYFQFGPDFSPFSQSNSDDSFSALDLSVKDIQSRNFGNAKIFSDNIFKYKFGINTKRYNTLNQIIGLGASNQSAVYLAQHIKSIELPKTLTWINHHSYKPNSIILASQNTDNFSNNSIRTNFMIVLYKTNTKRRSHRVLLAGYKDSDDIATALSRIPAGPTGAVGPVGPTGAAGPAGAHGAAGPTGAHGAAGPTGADGAVGPTGAHGAAGPTGAHGAAGPAGADGVTGPTGPAGLAGADGAVGPTGKKGPDGAVGPTGPAGLAGADGVTGPAGPTGKKGPDGAVGPAGLAGADGVTGPAGPAGLAGADGVTGPTGAVGPAGADGVTGPTGAVGPAGADGAAGTI